VNTDAPVVPTRALAGKKIYCASSGALEVTRRDAMTTGDTSAIHVAHRDEKRAR
jgi:hypothetical protein